MASPDTSSRRPKRPIAVLYQRAAFLVRVGLGAVLGLGLVLWCLPAPEPVMPALLAFHARHALSILAHTSPLFSAEAIHRLIMDVMMD